MKIFYRNLVNTRCSRNLGESSFNSSLFFSTVLSAFFTLWEQPVLMPNLNEGIFSYLIQFNTMQRTTINAWLPWKCCNASKKEEWLGLNLHLVEWYWEKPYSIHIWIQRFSYYFVFFFPPESIDHWNSGEIIPLTSKYSEVTINNYFHTIACAEKISACLLNFALTPSLGHYLTYNYHFWS